MKTLLTFALIALIGLLHHNAAGSILEPEMLTQSCCPNVTRVPIPRGMIQNVVRSNGRCQFPAIIVTTVCGRKICLDDGWDWATKLLTEFEKSTANNKPPSAPFNVSQCRNMTWRK